MNSKHSQLPQRWVYCIKLQINIYSLHTRWWIQYTHSCHSDGFTTYKASGKYILTAATATGLLYKASDKYIRVTYTVCGRRWWIQYTHSCHSNGFTTYKASGKYILTAATATGLLYKASDKYIRVTYTVCGRRWWIQYTHSCHSNRFTTYKASGKYILTAATATGLLYKASDKYILVTYTVCGRRWWIQYTHSCHSNGFTTYKASGKYILTAATATGLLYKASGNYILITYKMMNSKHSQLPQRWVYCIKLQINIYSQLPQRRVYCIKLQVNIYSLHTRWWIQYTHSCHSDRFTV